MRRPYYNIEELIGKKVNRLTPISWYINKEQANRKMLICRCDCGREVTLRPIDLVRNNSTQCGYCRNYHLVGQRYGKLIVLDNAGRNSKGRFLWLCQCDCGNTKTVETSRLTAGRTTNCGCYLKSDEHRRKLGDKNRLPPGVAARNKVIGTYKRNADLRNLNFDLSDNQIAALLSGDCFYCGAPPCGVVAERNSPGVFKYNGIDRLDNALGYIPGNIVSCCAHCNYKKGDQHVDEFLEWIKAVANHRGLCEQEFSGRAS